ncbi:MAG: response regulator, partial [Magnetococcales bacterium]|nr:response regulator [Magnetococcales bacterium]
AGQLELDPITFDLEQLVTSLETIFTEMVKKKGLAFGVEMDSALPKKFLGDEGRLRQILMNLLSNAIKFTENGEVVLTVEVVHRDKRRVSLLFKVRDTGIGLTEEQAGRLFHAFSQADTSTTRKYGGAGLGLAICKELVEMMGGSIGVQSEPGKGSIFSFTSDFSPALTAIGEAEEVEEGAVRLPHLMLPDEMVGVSVLLVDDRASVRQALADMMAFFGFKPQKASSGGEAIEALRKAADLQKPFPLVIMDVEMPDLDGLAVVQRVGEQLTEAQMPKIVLLPVVNRESDLHYHGVALGVDAFITKPVNCAELFDVAVTQLGGEASQRAGSKSDEVDPAKVVQRIGGARLLLVEDNTINQQVAREILEGVGMVVEVANNGLEATQRVHSVHYDAVLMDIQMPVMDGYAATGKIRSHAEFKNLPILAMTAHAMTGDRERCIDAGMNDYVTKPIDREQLFEALMRWVEPRDSAAGPVVIKKPKAVSEADMEEMPDNLPGIDVKAALNRLNGNTTMLRAILLDFERDFEGVDQIIRQCLNGRRQDDREQSLRHIHSVKGVAGNLAAKRLFGAARALESSVKAGKRDEWPPLMLEFELSHKEFLEGITILSEHVSAQAGDEAHENGSDVELGDEVGEEAPPVDPERLAVQLKVLSDTLANADIRSEEALAVLRGMLRSKLELHALLDQLGAQLDQFDFDGARESLTEISKGCGIS